MKTYYYNGSVVTMGAAGVTEALVTDDGIIAGAGTRADMCALAGAHCQRVDLQGGALLPGFIDAHSHLVSVAASLRFVSLADCRSWGDIVQALTAYIAQQVPAPEAWVVGFGYDHNLLKEGRHPTREMLDRVSERHPILISHASGHMGCVNTRALELAGIDALTPSPDGGVIGRESDGEQPNGYLEERAFMNLAAVIPPASETEMQALLTKAQEMYARYGITTVQEGYAQAMEYAALCRADAAGSLLLDVVGYADIKDHAALWEEDRQRVAAGRRFHLGGYKLFLDGSPQGRTAWLTQPYTAQEGQAADYRGYPLYGDEEVRQYVDQAQRDGAQLLVHCNGDAAIDQLLAAHTGPSPYRNVIIHAQLMRQDQLPLVKQRRLIPSYFVAHTYYWGDAHRRNLGHERAAVISPVASTAALDIPFTFHQDTPVLPPDMLDTLWCAVNRLTRDGVPLAAGEAVDIQTALKGLTVYGAYQYHEEARKGTLEPGKLADLVWLDRNPLLTDPMQLRDIQVCATIKDGRVLYAV